MDPVTIALLLGVAGVGLFAFKANASSSDALSSTTPSSGGAVFINNTFGFNLPDVDPSGQMGTYKRDYDDDIAAAATSSGVPFALIKAHAIAESSLVPSATKSESRGRKSYGLTQILWWPNSNRFANWGYSDDAIGDGSLLYDTKANTYIGAMIMQDNLNRFGNLDDAINAYNTGVAVSKRAAPFDYVNKVKKYYSALVGQQV